jgi:NAD(P)-dependent dehydrogenase (short-subunit alcohol dehydrogenase family)
MMNGTPAGRLGNPEAIAYAAVYLASDEAAFVHGSVLDVGGGRTTTAAGRTQTPNTRTINLGRSAS